MIHEKSKQVMIPKFHSQVYQVLRRVPRGTVTTYAALAREVGRPRASRAVGNAMNRNPFAPTVPCHRVVRSDGTVGGFAHGTAKKVAMLRHEGVKIEKGKVDLRRFGHKFSVRGKSDSGGYAWCG